MKNIINKQLAEDVKARCEEKKKILRQDAKWHTHQLAVVVGWHRT